MSQYYLYQPIPIEYDQPDFHKNYLKNQKQLIRISNRSKKEKKLVGRIIFHPIADGKACYQIVKEYDKTVRIKVCRGIGDDWTIPAWGEECTINKKRALEFIRYEEVWENLMKNKKSKGE